MGYPYDGILLVDKNEGGTSFGVVEKVRRVFKVKKAGHAGTLDPFATGLLVVLLGQGTKLSPYLMSGEKRYLATIRLGVETDTQDPTGRIVKTRPVPAFEPEYIEEKALGLIGEIEQVPPAFSAIRHRGKRAYEFARKGIKIDLKKRKVLVRYLKIISVELPDVIMEVACSPGTYVRSLAADLGKLLGPGGHLTALRRLSSKPFAVKDALNLEAIGSARPHSVFEDKIIPLRDALPQMKEAQVDDRMAHRVRNGCHPEFKELVSESDLPDFYEGHMKLVKGADLVAIMKVHHLSDTGERGLKIMRVFQ